MADYPTFDGLRARDNELRSAEAKYSMSHGKHKSSFTQFDIDVYDIAEELAALLIRKHHDYGPSNINGSPYGPIQGLVVRMWDKVARIVNLTKSGNEAKNEPLEDSFMDLANYAIIGLMVSRGKWPK
jgi:hypothetical protein